MSESYQKGYDAGYDDGYAGDAPRVGSGIVEGMLDFLNTEEVDDYENGYRDGYTEGKENRLEREG